MNKEIKRIDDKVKSQLEALTGVEQELKDLLQKKLDQENSRKKPRKTYVDHWTKMYNDSIIITDAARDMMEFTTEWNLIKEKLDNTCLDSKEPDPEGFAAALRELESIEPKELYSKCTRVKKIKRGYSIIKPIYNDLINQYDFMKRVYKNAPKHLKRMNMSEKQRASADRASFRMKMRWGIY